MLRPGQGTLRIGDFGGSRISYFRSHFDESVVFLGLSHGLLWIFMSLVCLAAARLRVVSLRLAVAVAVLGGIGPFFGSYEFIREGRSAERPAANVYGVVLKFRVTGLPTVMPVNAPWIGPPRS